MSLDQSFRNLKHPAVAVFGEHISGDDLKAFKLFYGRAKKPFTPEQKSIAEEYQQSANTRHIWFACDCRPGAITPPLLTTDRRGFVARLKKSDDRPPHSPGCPFYRNQEQQRHFVDGYRQPDRTDSFELHREFPDADRRAARRDEKRTDFSDRSVRTSRLQRLLWILLSEAQLNVLRPGTPKETAENQEIRIAAAVDNHMLHPAPFLPLDEIALSSVVSFQPRKYKAFAAAIKTTPDAHEGMEQWVRQQTIQHTPDDPSAPPPRAWPRGVRPQGFVIGVVVKIEDHVLHFADGGDIPIDGRLSIFGEEASKTFRYPYLAIVNLTRQSKAKPFIGAVDAYLHPIVSEDMWLPVDSNYERNTLLSLKKAQYRYFRNDTQIVITKPLFNMNKSDENEVVLPDFVIHFSDGRPNEYIVVETMGYNEAWYIQDKQRMHELMETQGLGKIFQYVGHMRPTHVDQAEAWEREWRRDLYEFAEL